MWPFRERLSQQDPLKKYREWLRRWLLSQRRTWLAALGLVAVLTPYFLWQWYNYQNRDVNLAVPELSVATSRVSRELGADVGAHQIPGGIKPAAGTVRTGTREADGGYAASNPKGSADSTAVAAAQAPVMPAFMKPLDGQVVRGFQEYFSAAFKEYRFHAAVDISGPAEAEVLAAADGRVSRIASDPALGWTVTVEHADGWQTFYAGLAGVGVKVGQAVKKGQPLAVLGAPGVAEEELGTHLHFAISHRGQSVDPSTLWSRS